MRPSYSKPLIGEQFDPTHWTHQACAGCWLMNEGMGTRIRDVSPNRNDAAMVNAPTWIGSKPIQSKGGGPAILFNGTNQRLSAPWIRPYDNLRNAFSIEAVVRVRGSLGSDQGIFGRGDLGVSAGTWGLRYNGSGGRFIFMLGGTTVFGLQVVLAANYYHIIGAWDGATIRLYERGADFRFQNGIPGVAKTSFTPSGTDDLNFGSAGLTTFLNGDLVFARLWPNRCVARDEAKELFTRPFMGWVPATQNRLYFFVTPTHSLDMRGNIRAVNSASLQMRSNIYGVQVQTLQMRASILGLPPSLTLRANIAEPETVADSLIESWETSDTFGEFSRQFSLTATEIATFTPGNEVKIKAGYDENRITIIDGLIDQVAISTGTDSVKVSVSGRDTGAREISSIRISKTWHSIPEKTMPRAHTVIAEAAAAAGMQIGTLDFPDYRLYQPFVAIGKTVLEIVAELVEPYNQFARVQYVTDIRDRLLSVKKIDYLNVPSGGYQLTRDEHASQSRVQRLYLDEPRLNEVEFFVIRGASWTTPKLDLGLTTKIEYFRSVATVEVQHSIGGVVQAPGDTTVKTSNPAITKTVITETTTTSQLYGDKVLNRIEEVVVDDDLVSRTTERYWYYEPAHTVSTASAILNGGIGPSDTTINVLNPIGFPGAAPYRIVIDNEIMLVTAGTAGLSWSVSRGQAGTDPATHPNGSAIAYEATGDNPQLVPVDVDTFIVQSLSPSPEALLWQVHSKREGLIDSNGGVVFREVLRNITQFYYTDNAEIALEVNTTQDLDEDTGRWGIINHSTRTHCQVTGGNVRTTLLNFTFEDSRYKIASADTQNVGGTRPKLNLPASKSDVLTHQAQAPSGEINAFGEPIDLGEGHYIWSFENPYIGQTVCDWLYQETLNERVFQQAGYRWEEIQFEGILNPNLRGGQPVSIEVAEGVFKDYWIANVDHKFTWNHAASSGTAKRLTLEDLS